MLISGVGFTFKTHTTDLWIFPTGFNEDLNILNEPAVVVEMQQMPPITEFKYIDFIGTFHFKIQRGKSAQLGVDLLADNTMVLCESTLTMKT